MKSVTTTATEPIVALNPDGSGFIWLVKSPAAISPRVDPLVVGELRGLSQLLRQASTMIIASTSRKYRRPAPARLALPRHRLLPSRPSSGIRGASGKAAPQGTWGERTDTLSRPRTPQ